MANDKEYIKQKNGRRGQFWFCRGVTRNRGYATNSGARKLGNRGSLGHDRNYDYSPPRNIFLYFAVIGNKTRWNKGMFNLPTGLWLIIGDI